MYITCGYQQSELWISAIAIAEYPQFRLLISTIRIADSAVRIADIHNVD